MEIRIHIIHEATREYLRTEAWTPPNAWTALPANATAVEPLPARAGYARVLTLTGDAWEYAEDHRGTSGYVNGEAHTIAQLGPLPRGWSTTPPVFVPTPQPPEFDVPVGEVDTLIGMMPTIGWEILARMGIE